MEYTV